MHKHSNHLIHETSPYLLQHAHNPVDWYPWGDKALNRAKEENKPILVSIGYAACHWCHVMERESFEDETTASLMNANFINIKIDREERPDLDHIYMDAVQAMTGSGGWPLNVFLTPEAKPFYGGTYFPPRKAFNRASWQDVLQGVMQAFNERRNEIEAQAENLLDHLTKSNSFGLQPASDGNELFTYEKLAEAADNILKAADKEWGGFGNAPKFPQTFTIQFLLRYHYVRGLPQTPSEGGGLRTPRLFEGDKQSASSQVSPNGGDLEGAGAALLSLDKMIQGGIYDQLGGGFARYSTDTEWLAPHFEKMLYDNALLVSVLSEAYQLTRKERYREVIEETMTFVQRELLHEQKGFYAALDADSEGEEGKFYVWQEREIMQYLGADASLFCKYYDVSNHGNWEGANILRVKQPLKDFAEAQGKTESEVKKIIDDGKKILLQERAKRERPLLDDKIILGWNALMNTACSKAFEATGQEAYRRLAIDNMQFLLEKFRAEEPGEFYHTWKEKAKYPAFLDDYAFLVQALLHLYEVTVDTVWLMEAKRVTEYVLEHFSEEETGFFYYTKKGQSDVIVRKKEVYDGAVPSGNSVMAYNLHHLSVFFNINEWKERAWKMVNSVGKTVTRYPTSFGVWNTLLLEMVSGTQEIAIVGKNAGMVQLELLKEFVPHRVLMASFESDDTFPLLREKQATDPASIYLCKNFACLRPVKTIKDLMSLISNDGGNI